jgi:TctA family transporter
MPSTRVSDVALGALLLVAAAIALWDAADLPGGIAPGGLDGPDAFPAALGVALAVIGIALIARASLAPHRPPPRWSAMQLLLILGGIVIVVAAFAFSPWSKPWVLEWGPPELAALHVLELAIAIAFARRSHLQALALVLLGLLLSVIGLDPATGILRMTFGIEALIDGIDWLVLAPALFVVADAAICVYSPQRFLALYARQVSGWTPPPVTEPMALAVRVAAAAAIAAAFALAYAVNDRWDDLVLLVLLAVFGVACRLYDWNRVVLLLAFSLGTMLEENIRRSMLLSQGDLEIFFRPIALGLLIAALIALATAAYLRYRLRTANPQ